MSDIIHAHVRNKRDHLEAMPMTRTDANILDPKNPSNKPPHVAPDFKPGGTLRYGPTNTAYRCEKVFVNDPDRFELFILGDGEKKVTETPDTRTPNTSIFTFLKEDHTLGNLLRAHLLKDPHVNFAGYRVPHPLFAKFELRVQTDGTISPKDAVVSCCKALVADLGQLGREFTKEFELRKMVGGGADGSKDNGL